MKKVKINSSLPGELLEQRNEMLNLLTILVDEMKDNYILGDDPLYPTLEEAEQIIKKATP
jgi:hypothetical protein